MGGVRNEVCRFSATNIAKKYGLIPNVSSIGKKIGTNMIKISDHSSGHPRRKMINCARTKNCQGSRFSARTQCSMMSCPPRYEKIEAKVHDPTNNQHTIAVALAVRNTLSLTLVHVNSR